MNSSLSFIIAQIIGIIGSGIGFWGDFQDDRAKLLKINILAYSIVLIHYIILGTNNLAIAFGLVYILKNILSLFLTRDDNSKYVYYIIYPLMITVSYFSFNDWRVDTFAIVSIILDAIAKNFINLQNLRLFSLLSCLSWLGFVIGVGTYSGIIVSIIHITILSFKLYSNKTK